MINILIQGPACCGKTTIACVISSALLDAGLDCRVDDSDGDFRFVMKTLQKRIDRIKEKAGVIQIQEEQTK